jgi:hypothetical protein
LIGRPPKKRTPTGSRVTPCVGLEALDDRCRS